MPRIQFGAEEKLNHLIFLRGQHPPNSVRPSANQKASMVRGRGQYAPNSIWRRRNFTVPIKSEAVIFLFTFIRGSVSAELSELIMG